MPSRMKGGQTPPLRWLSNDNHLAMCSHYHQVAAFPQAAEARHAFRFAATEALAGERIDGYREPLRGVDHDRASTFRTDTDTGYGDLFVAHGVKRTKPGVSLGVFTQTEGQRRTSAAVHPLDEGAMPTPLR